MSTEETTEGGRRIVATFTVWSNDETQAVFSILGEAASKGLISTIAIGQHPYDHLPPVPSVAELERAQVERFKRTDGPPTDPAPPRERKKTGRPTKAEAAAKAAAKAAAAAHGNGVADSAVTHGGAGADGANSFVSHARQSSIPGS